LSGPITGVTGGSYYVIQSDSGTLSLTGGFALDHTLVLQGNGNGSITGGITTAGTGGVTVAGAGAWTIGGTNTYTGATSVQSGTLIVSGSLSGSSAVTVGNSASLTTSAILAGGGQVGGVTLGAAAGNTGAEVEPADGVTEDVGAGTTLTTSAFSILASSTSTLALQVGRSDGVDQVSASGDSSDKINATAVSLNSTGNLSLSLETGYTPAAGDVLYLIISGAAPTGTFATVNGSAIAGNQFTFDGDTWEIGYNVTSGGVFSGGDDVAIEELAAVPEPGTWASLLGGVGMLIIWQRRRSRGLGDVIAPP
jgi:autotransporter-associated beta strand protein